MITVTHVLGWSRGSETITEAVRLSAAAASDLEESIPGEAEDLEIMWVMDVSTLVALCIVASRDLTVLTNSTETPDDTLELRAGEPVLWHAESPLACPLTADVTALYVTNEAAASATLSIRALYDPTPD